MVDAPRSVLIVDDSLVEQTFLNDSLTANGYEVTVTSNGKEALEVLKRTFIPLVITDWVMPEMDGLELCSRIRQEEFPSYIFIILLTGKGQKKDIITGLDAGADDYIIKPVDLPELLARIRTGKRVLRLERNLSNALEQVKTMLITDTLTGCYNRRYLMESLPNEIKRSKRYGHNLSLAMMDIDNFKKINDTYGHQAGDKVLCEITSNINSAIRSGLDWLARYGGEEFVLILPETDLGGAKKTIERVQDSLSSMIIPVGSEILNITLSFGLTTYNPVNDTEEISGEILLKVADHYLYRAKKEGKNRYIADSVEAGFAQKIT
ncbi:MAG: diguanylate cyclase [bacterium]